MPTDSNRCRELTAHYATQWSNSPTVHRWHSGPIFELPNSFCVLEFPPSQLRAMWTYATCGMSQAFDDEQLEVHLFSPIASENHVELLTAVAHFHRTGDALGLGHTVNFGRPWLNDSLCDHGVITLPYLDGPTIEVCRLLSQSEVIRCLWLVPITKSERQFKHLHGLEALEQCLEGANFNYLDPHRRSVI